MVMSLPTKESIFLAGLLLVGISGCNSSPSTMEDQTPVAATIVENVMDSSILIPVGSLTLDYFPCNDCHSELEPNPERRELVEMHDDIVFDHDSENRWCLACHYINNRDSLVLAGGKRLGFDESYKLCGQCHGPKFRDWRLGIHGKRTGDWNGQKQYFLCANCHDPHSPRINPIEPMPPPRRPERIKIDTSYERPEKAAASI